MNTKLRIILFFLLVMTLSWRQDCCDAAEDATADCGGLGCYIPQCTEDCNWEPMQCWSSTGYCWCVDENGVEIEGTSMPSWQGTPDCEEHAQECFDFTGIDFGVCTMVLGVGLVSDECNYISGCDWIANNGVDYSDMFFDNIEECEEVCDIDESTELGDINGDGEINILDVVMVIGFIIGTNTPSDSESFSADYNGDGLVNVLDVVAIVSLITNPEEEEEELPEECYLEPDPGPCFGYVPMYFFNQETQSCEQFIYGGCAGVVPFESYSECQDACE